MSKLLALKAATKLGDVADLLGFKPSYLAYVLYKLPDAAKYKKFTIPKKAGGEREISSPVGPLKDAQRALSDLLNECRDEIQEATPRKPLSHGFRKKLSIVSNARNHTNRRYVLNVDLADFFPTFNFGRVRGFFLKDKDFELDEKIATLLAKIACFENGLPQGSPCSPVIADMIAHLLDVRLVQLAKKHHVTYSRYADDLSFSTNQKEFPAELALLAEAEGGSWIAGDALVKVIEKSGFLLNPTKTRMQIKGSRQLVTGLTVNAKANVTRTYWRSLRSMCRSMYETGSYHLPTPKAGVPEGAVPENITSLAPLAGMMSHVRNVKLKSERLPNDAKPDVVYGHADHVRFWFYKTFVALERPLIVCEGPTDSIYLRNAIAHLPAFQPTLGEKTPEGFSYAMTFFNYTNEVHRILGLTGGASLLVSLMHSYAKRMRAYKHKPLLFPVIILLDNDTVLSPKVAKPLNSRFGTSISNASTDPFFHLTENLYLVKTPHVAGAPMSEIEDFFDAATKTIPVEGKLFHAEGEGFDKAIHISKAPFAHRVVRPHANAINWDGFTPLLERLVAVLADHAAKVGAP